MFGRAGTFQSPDKGLARDLLTDDIATFYQALCPALSLPLFLYSEFC